MKRISIYFFCVVAIGCITSSILYWENEKSNQIKVEKPVQVKEYDSSEKSTQTFENNFLITEDRDNGIHSVKQEMNTRKRDDSWNEKGFWMKEENGFLVIYDAESLQMYDETTIQLSDLPERLQLCIAEGIYFGNEQELYAFLENYSS